MSFFSVASIVEILGELGHGRVVPVPATGRVARGDCDLPGDLKRVVMRRSGSADGTEEATFCQWLNRRQKNHGIATIDQVLVTTNKRTGRVVALGSEQNAARSLTATADACGNLPAQ